MRRLSAQVDLVTGLSLKHPERAANGITEPVQCAQLHCNRGDLFFARRSFLQQVVDRDKADICLNSFEVALEHADVDQRGVRAIRP